MARRRVAFQSQSGISSFVSKDAVFMNKISNALKTVHENYGYKAVQDCLQTDDVTGEADVDLDVLCAMLDRSKSKLKSQCCAMFFASKTQYDTTSKDYEWYVENIRPGMEHYADCVDKGEYCIDLIMDKANKNEAWAVALNGFYPAAANDCPTNSMTINNAQYSADGKCYGAIHCHSITHPRSSIAPS
eukprot:744069_1